MLDHDNRCPPFKGGTPLSSRATPPCRGASGEEWRRLVKEENSLCLTTPCTSKTLLPYPQGGSEQGGARLPSLTCCAWLLSRLSREKDLSGQLRELTSYIMATCKVLHRPSSLAVAKVISGHNLPFDSCTPHSSIGCCFIGQLFLAQHPPPLPPFGKLCSPTHGGGGVTRFAG